MLERVARFAAQHEFDEDLYLSELLPDGCDFIDLCEDLEKTFRIDLRPFFEDGQPEVGWGPWRLKVAREVTAAELANHVERLVLTPS